jgi:hypothetical protein
MTGLEFVLIVRRRFPSIPVIILSGAAPGDLPPEAKPDVLLHKGALKIPELVRIVRDLVRKTPDPAGSPHVMTTLVQRGPDFTGSFTLTCTDCLRKFQATTAPENTAVEQTAICTHCEARVPFLIESSEPA